MSQVVIGGYSPQEREKLYDFQSINTRLELLYKHFDHLSTFISRGKYRNKDPKNNVQLIRGFWEDGKHVREWFIGHNIVTVDGRVYYAKKGAGETPGANLNFLTGKFQLANPTTQNAVAASDTWDQFDSAVAGANAAGSGAAISASIIAFTAGYPKTDDSADSDNTGDGLNVNTFQAFWNAASFNDGGTNIKNGCIHDNASPTAATKLLCHFQTPTAGGVQKAATDTLKGIVNQTVGSS